MPNTTNCKVSFDDNPDRVYYGGQTVRGRVHLTLAKEKTIRGERFLSIFYHHYYYYYDVQQQFRMEFIVLSPSS